jgi:NADPH:quinone reductase
VKIIEILESGGPEVLQLGETPTPTPGDGEVLIQAADSGGHLIDLYVQEGRYGNKPPFTPGQETARTIVALGANKSHLKNTYPHGRPPGALRPG